MGNHRKAQIILPDNSTINIETGKSLAETAMVEKVKANYISTIVAALVNNSLQELDYTVKEKDEIYFIDLSDREGQRIYSRSLTFLLIKATADLFPKSRLMVEHSLGKGLYCELHGKMQLNSKRVQMIEDRMKELVKADIKFEKELATTDKAIEHFSSMGRLDNVELLKYKIKSTLTLYSLDGIKEYLFGYLVPSTGYLKKFALKFYMPGMILRYPDIFSPDTIPKYIEQPKLFEVFRESENWYSILGLDTVGDLNRKIEQNNSAELIRVAEAMQEKKIAKIADSISENRNNIRVILIAGPSSSGKTTFAQRLRVQLLVNGVRPLSISLDDYFVDREKTPLDEQGDLDFESIEALDLELFNEQLVSLIRQEEIQVPSFDFTIGKRKAETTAIKLEKDQPVIIEGIHGLNDRLTEAIPKWNKYKIYISALTSLNLDRHNRIHTTDSRMLRRIIRDNFFRGHKAVDTIRIWPSVQRGEEKNIFPFQEDADIMFNSVLPYEFSALKPYAEKVLAEINPEEPEYLTAKRLQRFLSYFLAINCDDVPRNSILREFIGNSCFI